ncbi:MAG: helix-turn-helix domain-containing protein [Chloroflexia bacterium]
MALSLILDPSKASPEEQQVFSQLEIALESTQAPRLLGHDGEEIELPESLYNLLIQIVHDLSQGRNIALVRRDHMLTTQQAADILNVSRPYLVTLLERGEMLFTRVGKHRRINFDDLMKYKQQRDQDRRYGLVQITRLGEEMGDYD